jgi:putative endonuclease
MNVSTGGAGMLDLRKILGKYGENLAVRYLKKRGCRIIETNYRNTLGEIDIIAMDRDVITFVEVKTRSDNRFSPKEAVTPMKRRRITRVAQSWLKVNKRWAEKARFDVIAVINGDDGTDIEWIRNAFELTDGSWR